MRRLSLIGHPVDRDVLPRICDLLGLDPTEVKEVWITPSEVCVEHYATNADGRKYAVIDEPRRLGRLPRIVTFWTHHPVCP